MFSFTVGTACTIERQQTSGGSVMLWTMFSWEILGPAIHMDVALTCTTYPQHCCRNPFMEMIFPDGYALFLSIICPATKQKWFFSQLTHGNPIKQLWDILDKPVHVPYLETYRTQRNCCYQLLTSWCQTTQDPFMVLVEFMPPWVVIFSRKVHRMLVRSV